jgi:hypothetical protein
VGQPEASRETRKRKPRPQGVNRQPEPVTERPRFYGQPFSTRPCFVHLFRHDGLMSPFFSTQ